MMLSIEKCQQMLHRIKTVTHCTDELLAERLQTHPSMIARLQQGEPLTEAIETQLIKLFCKTCK